jgi:AcrR family transcriptional regulator
MNKKEVQRKRKMAYFIDAAKEIIKEEGIKAVTARKVGERAGYSYATIYNYFKDLNELLAYCSFDFLEDCYEYMIGFKDEEKDSLEQLIIYSCAYFEYFAQNSDLFYLTFIEDVGEIPEAISNGNTRPSVDLLLRETLAGCVREGYAPEDSIELLGELISASIHGKLLFYTGGRHSGRSEEMIDLIKMEIKFLLAGGKNEKE